MTTLAASKAFTLEEPIPGYRMKERIGAGGCGEVWSAEAPGGIAKAIKVVFGYHNDERAARELNALNRIKQVRHPFVLSLERIELVDGHLIIVTELATSNMKQLFEEHRRSGKAGIPREELLGHLRDAADALDYLCQEHSLQHLDVKPENLLLLGGRIKVGDFGLVKDLQDVNCSNISGMTPVYAAPELFDGRPNNHSDQYSLAIVYQEMLTGALPYEGRTTAQLAAQHLHSRPRLDALPVSDRAIIARALAKDPAQRFPTCREMAESLREATSNRPARSTRAAAEPVGYQPPLPPVKTEVISRDAVQLSAAAAQETACSMTQPTEPAPTVYDLCPLDLKPDDAEYGPTVFIGIGGLAARTLRSLRRRLVERFRDMDAVPAIQMLLFDTDAETLQAVTERDNPSSLDDESAILLPLRQAADYRQDTDKHLLWLSRRWIYNIPRSLQTQGLRPLGRLALVDHFDRVWERLGRTIRAAVDTEGLANSAMETGLPFRKAAPRVYIVSSTSGGTGSGMALDVAYLVRKMLREMGLADEWICGVLAHLSGRHAQGRDLAVANTYAMFGEMYHYSDPRHAYPGDPACGVPAFAPQDAPFSQAYVVNLGEELEPAALTAAADKLAKYLYYNAVTPAEAFFRRCRAADAAGNPPSADAARVRTFGLCQLGFSYDDVPAAAADQLCEALVTRWRGLERTDSQQHPASLADPTSLLAPQFALRGCADDLRAEVASRAERLKLGIHYIADELLTAANREMGAEAEAYLLAVLAELVHNYGEQLGGDKRFPPGRWLIDGLNTLIRSQAMPEQQSVCLESVLEKYLREMAARKGAELAQWILSLVNSPKHRLGGAQRTADYVTDYLRMLSQQAGEAIQALRREIAALEATLLVDKNGACTWLRRRGFGSRRRLAADRRASQYFRLRIRELTLNGACRFTGLVLSQMAAVTDKLRNLAAELNQLAEDSRSSPKTPASVEADGDGPQNIRRAATELVEAHKAELVTEMEASLEDDLRRVVANDDNNARRVLSRLLRRTAHATILKALKRINREEINTGDGGPHERIFSLAAGLERATPRLPNCGGARRLLLVAAEGPSAAQWSEQLGDKVTEPPTVVADTESDVLLCCEMEQLPLRRVATALLDGRFHNVEVASRLHTRIDVPWSPL